MREWVTLGTNMFKDKYNAWKENYCALECALDYDINPCLPYFSILILAFLGLCIDIYCKCNATALSILNLS